MLPGFEEMRARELIHVGDDIRVWQEDESPYQRIVQGLKDRGVGCRPGRVGIDDAARFFVFDGIRKLAPKLRVRWRTTGVEGRGRRHHSGARTRARSRPALTIYSSMLVPTRRLG